MDKWLRRLFAEEEGDTGGGGDAGGADAADGGDAAGDSGDGSATATDNGFDLLGAKFDEDERIPERFRNKPITETFEAWKNAQKKITQLSQKIKELETPKKGKQGVSAKDIEKQTAELQQTWDGLYQKYDQDGEFDGEAASVISGRLTDAGIPFVDNDTLREFAEYRKQRREQYLTSSQEALNAAKIEADAHSLVGLFAEHQNLFSEADVSAMNQLVKLKDPHAMIMIAERLQKAGVQFTGKKDSSPKPPGRTGDANAPAGTGSFSSPQDYEKALAAATKTFKETGDRTQMDAVDKKLERSRYWRK